MSQLLPLLYTAQNIYFLWPASLMYHSITRKPVQTARLQSQKMSVIAGSVF
jgi:hypothetical protein